MNKKLAVICLTAPLVLTLPGCLIVTEKHASDTNQHSESEREQRNRAMIASLTMSTSLPLVREQLGVPDFSESVRIDGDDYQVLYYRTQRVKGDGLTTKDECTPLVFEDQQLIGSGQLALDRLH